MLSVVNFCRLSSLAFGGTRIAIGCTRKARGHTSKGIITPYRTLTLNLRLNTFSCRISLPVIRSRLSGQGNRKSVVLDVSQFRSMVGSLVYITITGPDIADVVGVVSQFMQKPRTIHLDAAYRILRYLKGSPFPGLLFPSSSSLQMTGDSDGDWAGDALDRKSITGNKLYCHWRQLYIVEEQEAAA